MRYQSETICQSYGAGGIYKIFMVRGPCDFVGPGWVSLCLQDIFKISARCTQQCVSNCTSEARRSRCGRSYLKAIEGSEEGVTGFLSDIHESLKTKTYKPEAVRRVYIPKPDGRKRPLGIPTIRDRVIQTAVLLIVEPIFEADFMECSYGCRN